MKVNKEMNADVDYMTAANLSELFEKLTEKYNNMISNIQREDLNAKITGVSFDKENAYGDDTNHVLQINYTREETEKEKSLREARDADSINWKRRQYEALKKEFGDK